MSEGSIWCLDLEHNEKWYKSPQKLPDFDCKDKWMMTPFGIKDDDNNVHFISFIKNNNHHFKASLFDLLPLQILTLNRDKYDPLIIGFIKKFEAKNKPIFIPLYLKKLIVQFYPIFI